VKLSLVWYIESRSSLGGGPQMGSAVVVRVVPKDGGEGTNLLLTCQHVVRKDDWGEVHEEILAFPPELGFTDPGICKDRELGRPTVGSFLATPWRAIDQPEKLDIEFQGLAHDWILLEVDDPEFQNVDRVKHFATVHADHELRVLGYPGGAESFLADRIVRPTPATLTVMASAEPGLLRLTGPEGATQPGMSGGGALVNGGLSLAGIHRAHSQEQLKFGSVSIEHIATKLTEHGFEFVADRNKSLIPLQQLAVQASRLCAELRESLRTEARPENLYSSNGGGDKPDDPPSATVSSMVALALSQSADRFGAYVIEGLVEMQKSDGSWPAETGDGAHTMSAAWGLLACSHAVPTRADVLRRTAAWLLAQRSANDAFPLYKDRQPSPFYTAYVLNALAEYTKVLQLQGGSEEEIAQTNLEIRRGLGYLENCGTMGPPGTLLYGNGLSGDHACLATTSMVLHVYCKLTTMKDDFSQNKKTELTRTHELLSGLLADGFDEIEVRIPDCDKMLEIWPSIVENNPSYWFNYFAPTAALTLLELARTSFDDVDDRAKRFEASAVRRAVEWIIQKKIVNDSGRAVGIRRSPKIDKSAVWATAQSVMVLRLWLDALPDYFGLGEDDN